MAAPTLEALPAAPTRSTLSALRRHLHQIPELGFQERKSSAYVRGWLRDHGFKPSEPLAGTGFYVDVPGAGPGPTVAYRADMDALPIVDAKEVDYASRHHGVTHACGHDAHMTIACGVALEARRRADDFAGTVRVFFQPCEESVPSGAPAMMADGLLEAHGAAEPVRSVYAVHVDPTLPVGRIGLRVGSLTAACSPFIVRVASGQSGHSARPHEAIDTVWVANQIASDLYQLAGRITDARKAAVLTICRFVGGDALNVIPSEVEFGGTLRCVDRETMQMLREKMRRVAGALGAVYKADVDVEFAHLLPPVVNTAREVGVARTSVESVLDDEAVVELPMPSMGGEDFAYYLEEKPGAMVRVGSAGGPETRYPLHHARFDIDEGALPLAARVMADVCIRDLNSPA